MTTMCEICGKEILFGDPCHAYEITDREGGFVKGYSVHVVCLLCWAVEEWIAVRQHREEAAPCYEEGHHEC